MGKGSGGKFFFFISLARLPFRLLPLASRHEPRRRGKGMKESRERFFINQRTETEKESEMRNVFKNFPVCCDDRNVK